MSYFVAQLAKVTYFTPKKIIKWIWWPCLRDTNILGMAGQAASEVEENSRLSLQICQNPRTSFLLPPAKWLDAEKSNFHGQTKSDIYMSLLLGILYKSLLIQTKAVSKYIRMPSNRVLFSVALIRALTNNRVCSKNAWLWAGDLPFAVNVVEETYQRRGTFGVQEVEEK